MVETAGEIRKHRHPGAGKRRAGRHPKGRQVEERALTEVQALLGDRPRQRDLLIEHLHLIQDHYGYLSAAHLAALGLEMRLPQAAVYEAATFYAHFDVVKEGETPPPPLTIRVCDSLTCEMMGAAQLLAALRAQHDPSRVRVVRAPCMGHCDTAPVAEVAHHYVDHATPAKVAEAVRRGLGGAGFPAGRKWEFVRKEPKPRYLTVNADEGEPGTFKDRYYLERDPHRFLEGVLIAAWSIEAEAAYIYLRDEYPGVRDLLLTEIPKIEAAGLAEPGYLRLRRGAGAYICGEESAMLESIEGK